MASRWWGGALNLLMWLRYILYTLSAHCSPPASSESASFETFVWRNKRRVPPLQHWQPTTYFDLLHLCTRTQRHYSVQSGQIPMRRTVFLFQQTEQGAREWNKYARLLDPARQLFT
ncbi:hypothetical protein EDC01DRAFT_163168 [Geopyxis carbonaria]|nr:hypothetical protein EDC01DRAFT_163168 [Geopyxis carbonaria]